MKVKIFAYGSNMFYDRLVERVGVDNVEFFDKGNLTYYKLVFNKKSEDESSKANIKFTNKKSDKVFGVIYQIDKSKIHELDKVENGYEKVKIPVNCGDKTYGDCFVYVAKEEFIQNNLLPYGWYKSLIIEGAKNFCIPQRYITNTLLPVRVKQDLNDERKVKNQISYLAHNSEMGGFYLDDWKSLRDILKDTSEYNDDWKRAMEFFKARMKNRYFDPIDRVENRDTGVGFLIVSIQCILLEHFAALLKGKIHNAYSNDSSPKYEYRKSEDFYMEFLRTEPIFENIFFTIDGTFPSFCADDFYKNVRCALLHEACTKNGWLINTTRCIPGNHNVIEKSLSTGKKRIFRDILNQKLKDFLIDFEERLKVDHKLRLNLARKIDSLCEIESDPENYVWWINED